jgi:hypothetical protein
VRRRKEDDPFVASEREHAQSELTCIATRRKCVNIHNNIVLIALLFQENKSFGAITICIHPLMYVNRVGNINIGSSIADLQIIQYVSYI